jgi:hypothetical protein
VEVNRLEDPGAGAADRVAIFTTFDATDLVADHQTGSSRTLTGCVNVAKFAVSLSARLSTRTLQQTVLPDIAWIETLKPFPAKCRLLPCASYYGGGNHGPWTHTPQSGIESRGPHDFVGLDEKTEDRAGSGQTIPDCPAGR